MPKLTELRLGKPKFPAVTEQTSLSDLIGPQSHFIFQRLGLEYDWLTKDVSEWSQQPSFERVQKVINCLKVTNDSSERMVKLATDFGPHLTKDSKEKQRLYQVVEFHRKKFCDFKKSNLNQ